jgi:alkylated DNA repair dioxygenase AlkB
VCLVPGPLQTDLFASGPPALAGLGQIERTWLDPASWVDLRRGWVQGGDELFVMLRERARWREASRPMYGRVVDVPRLTASVAEHADSLPSIVHNIGHSLSEHYQTSLMIDLIAYYRDGNDSVAWHADRIDATRAEHTSAIVSLGGPRRLLFRQKGGGPTRLALSLASGDLLVLGGAMQHRFEHCVPKARYAPPRISLLAFGVFAEKTLNETFRPALSQAVGS